MVDLSIIIPSYNTKEVTINCINSIVKFTKNINYEIIVVDNASTDGSPKAISDLKIKNLILKICKSNLGFAKANNIGIKNAKGKFVLFLNSDTIISSNLFPEMISWFEKNQKVGAITCKLKNKNDSLQETGGFFPTLLRVFSWMFIQDIPFVDNFIKPFHPNTNFYKRQKELDWLTGAFILTKKEILKKVRWSEKYFLYTEDVDFCFKIRNLSYKIFYLPNWSIIHLGGASGTHEKTILREFQGIKIFYKNHYPKWQYPILRLILKLGCLPRIIISPKIYAKAFLQV